LSSNVSIIDLRSDTVTRPIAAMRQAMAAAAVGDDGYHEDPTVTRLEALSARILGKDAALYMPSGTMSNLVAALTHCTIEQRVVLMANSHIGWTLTYDPRLSSLTSLTMISDRERGFAGADDVRAALDPVDGIQAGLVCIENSHNLAGGKALRPDETGQMTAVAHERGVPVHLDGARIFNASVALGIPASELAAEADSVTFCLSKGLGAPIGSVLCGSEAFIEKARVHRQYVGGTMRQAGIVAAAGVVALETMINRLADDHANAHVLAEGFATVPGVRLPFGMPETNLVYIDVADTGLTAAEVVTRLKPHGVLLGDFYDDKLIRAVTHVDINRADCETAIEALRNVLSPVTVGL
jgi:threonine aldolase